MVSATVRRPHEMDPNDPLQNSNQSVKSKQNHGASCPPQERFNVTNFPKSHILNRRKPESNLLALAPPLQLWFLLIPSHLAQSFHNIRSKKER